MPALWKPSSPKTSSAASSNRCRVRRPRGVDGRGMTGAAAARGASLAEPERCFIYQVGTIGRTAPAAQVAPPAPWIRRLLDLGLDELAGDLRGGVDELERLGLCLPERGDTRGDEA